MDPQLTHPTIGLDRTVAVAEMFNCVEHRLRDPKMGSQVALKCWELEVAGVAALSGARVAPKQRQHHALPFLPLNPKP